MVGWPALISAGLLSTILLHYLAQSASFAAHPPRSVKYELMSFMRIYSHDLRSIQPGMRLCTICAVRRGAEWPALCLVMLLLCTSLSLYSDPRHDWLGLQRAKGWDDHNDSPFPNNIVTCKHHAPESIMIAGIQPCVG